MEAILKDLAPGTVVQFPGRRKRYRIKRHGQHFIKMRGGLSSDYADGCNYDLLQGTHLWRSNGGIICEQSDRVLKVINQIK
jgi:hypothetical protein